MSHFSTSTWSTRGGNTLHPLTWDTNSEESQGNVGAAFLVTVTQSCGLQSVTQNSHLAAQCAPVPSPSSPTVTHSADVAKQSLCHHACRKPFTSVPMMNPVSLPSFISMTMCPQGECASRHLCTSSSLMVQDIILDFNPLQPFEFAHSLLKLVCEAKIH